MELTRTAEPQINFAVVDLGSNTIRMTLYDVQEQGGFQALFSEKRMAGLVNYIRSGSLTREGIEVACSVLRGFQRLLAQFGPVPMHVFATASLRNIRNTEEVLAAIRENTGLMPDAYFSATKIKWILDNVPGARERAERGDLLFGNVDSWLIWNLTGGRAHVSDYSNCSRTMLFDIDRLCWDEKLCERLGIPMSMLPTPVPSSMVYGRVTAGLSGLEALEGVPVCGSAGDQAAALLGQACIEPGQAKNTYGTGCFTLMNTGNKSVRSVSGLVTSVAWSVNGETTYALEGSVFNAGSSIQWLRDELGIIGAAHECDLLAESVPDNGGVYLVSAFTGLGAPRWDMYARGAIVGLTRGSNKAHIARATLEGIAYQVKDLLDAMQIDAESPISVLRVDGGASVSSFLMQFQADMLRVPIDRPKLVETTAFGAAFLAGLASGVWESVDDIALLRQSDRIFKPEMDAEQAKRQHDNWLRAVGRAEKWSLE